MNPTYASKFIIILFVVLMISSPIASAASVGGSADTSGVAQVEPDSVTFSSEGGDIVKNKISTSVQTRLEDYEDVSAELTPVIIVFKTQPEDRVDLGSVSATEAKVGMKSLAENTQQPYLEYLESQQKAGKAADITSLHLRNAIAVKADQETIQAIAGTAAVDKVIYDSTVSVADDAGGEAVASEFYDRYTTGEDASLTPQEFEGSVSGDRARGVENIGADAIQESGITGEGINVSIVDTGINDSHPALKGQVIQEKNFANSKDPEEVGDPEGHGTHVAGTVAGKRSADKAVGVAPGANLFDARALGANGYGNISDIIEAFEWSNNQSADIVSASLGYGPFFDETGDTVDISTESANQASFEIYNNGSQIDEVTDDGFQPTSLFVGVSDVTNTNGSSNVSVGTENLSVTLENPSGAESLQRYNGTFVEYNNDRVDEDSPILYKYKPSSRTPLTSGTWEVNVENQNDANISADVETLTIYTPDGTDQLSKVANNLAASGTIPIVAAGNFGELGRDTIGAPAAAEDAISVGATKFDSIDIAEYSSRGKIGFGNNVRNGIDLIAPGTRVTSTQSPQTDFSPDGEYEYTGETGTSMATPHVSGTAALMLASADSSLSPSEVEAELEATAESVPRRSEVSVGSGSLDAFAAVNAVTSDSLDENATGNNKIDQLYAGVSAEGDRLDVDTEPITDPVGDAGSAPDIQEADERVGPTEARFVIGLADDTAPNATFTTYLDTDQNTATGDTRGAEYRATVDRIYKNDEYSGTITVEKYDTDSGGYVSSNVDASVDNGKFDDRPAYIEWYIHTTPNDNDGIGTTAFDWYLTAEDDASTSTDRLPDSGFIDSNQTVTVPAVGVAWNSTTGPVENRPLNFTIEEESSFDGDDEKVVANRVVRTDSTGVASPEFTFTDVGESTNDFSIIIRDGAGNEVFQTIDIDPPYIDREQRLEDKENISVADRSYKVSSNETVNISVPVYNTSGKGITPYDGPASMAIEGYNDNRVSINATNTNGNGVSTAQFNTSKLSGFDDYYPDLQLQLTENFTTTGETYEAGDIDRHRGDVGYAAHLSPERQVTQSQTDTTVTYQLSKEAYQQGSDRRDIIPASVDAEYSVNWVTDRFTQSLYSNLSDSLAKKLELNYQTQAQAEPLSKTERRNVQQAIENISTQDTSRVRRSGMLTPNNRGVGQFTLTPPEDARYGFVSVTDPSEPTDYRFYGRSVVYVDQRVGNYDRDSDQQYALDIEGD